MDHQTGAAGQRPQKLTAKIERMGGGWREVSWRNTGIRLETGLHPATVCRPRRPCSSPNGFVVRSSALSQLTVLAKPALRKALCRPLFRTSFLPAGCSEFRARINGRARRLIIQAAGKPPIPNTPISNTHDLDFQPSDKFKPTNPYEVFCFSSRFRLNFEGNS